LGIIAFNQSQQSAIEDAIYDRRRKYPEVELLFHTGLSEPLFVKNLENVQGDERDVIILSMGYGYNEAGKFLKNFGPLTKSGGERRLNVAVTRAREEVILVASVKAADLDLSGSTSRGSHLLKGYLEYAERGVDSLAREISSITGEAESTFEQEVATALIQRGLHPVLQVGCGGFRIDLAVKHPQRPGEFCLGIECDGATYHSSKTARDRDRIRQNVLENLGWNIVRIWSTDWIRNSDRQIERVLAAYERASTLNSIRPAPPEPSIDDDLDDLQPRIEVPVVATGPIFKSIKDVPEEHLRRTFQAVVKRGGAIDLEGLIQQTVRELGFARTGKQIRQRLENSLNDLLQLGHLRWIGDRIASAEVV
jgi:very-short-patch-repair endonuclease